MTPTEAAITILRARCQFSDEQICHDIRLLLAQRDRYEKALRDLVERLEYVHNHEHYKSVWTLYMIHGGDYSNGPTYKAELDAAQEALRCE